MDAPNLTNEQLMAKWSHVLDATKDIFTWTDGHELAWLCEMASRARMICEVGSYHGKSAKCMALANPNCKLLCIDLCEDVKSLDVFRQNLSAEISSGQVSIIQGESSALAKMDKFPQFDACFIDGGHMFEDVSHDITRLRPHMLPGALMAGHDWRANDPNDGVNRAVEQSFRKEEIRVFKSIWHVQLP